MNVKLIGLLFIFCVSCLTIGITELRSNVPTTMVVMDYVENESTVSERHYFTNVYDCRHFARDLTTELKVKYPYAIPKIEIVGERGNLHAIVRLHTQEGILLIDSQANKDVTYKYEVGKHQLWNLYYYLGGM